MKVIIGIGIIVAMIFIWLGWEMKSAMVQCSQCDWLYSCKKKSCPNCGNQPR